MSEPLFEVMPIQHVTEKTIQEFYANDWQREQLELEGFIALNPTASSGYAIKTIREILT